MTLEDPRTAAPLAGLDPTGVVIAADIGGSTMHAAVVSRGSVAGGRTHALSPADESPDAVLDRFERCLTEAAADVPAGVPITASVAICGPADMATGTFARPSGKFSACTGVPLVAPLAERLGWPVQFHHDAVAHAVGASASLPGARVLAAIAGTGASLLLAAGGHCDPHPAPAPGVGVDGLSLTRFGSAGLAEWAGIDTLPWWGPRAALEDTWALRHGGTAGVRDICVAADRGDRDATALLDELAACWVRVISVASEQVPFDVVAFAGGVAEGLDLAGRVTEALGIPTCYTDPDTALVGAAALAAA